MGEISGRFEHFYFNPNESILLRYLMAA